MYNNISFTSTIRPVTVPQYKQEVLAFEKPCVAKFPWTINEAVIGENVVTTNVMDCSVCGIKIKDKVFLLHTTPFHELNKDFAKIEAIIKENVDLKTDDIQAILIGGKPPYTHGPESYQHFEKYEAFLQKHNIPYSKLKGGMGIRHVAYSNKKDEWLIAHDKIARPQERLRTTPIQELKNIFSEISISEKDNVSWYA